MKKIVILLSLLSSAAFAQDVCTKCEKDIFKYKQNGVTTYSHFHPNSAEAKAFASSNNPVAVTNNPVNRLGIARSELIALQGMNNKTGAQLVKETDLIVEIARLQDSLR